VQTQGSLQESSLASLLQTMQMERATGALALESQTDTASLYFLFGHLFHAQGPAGEGEDVVINALSWQDGRFRFDPRAKLPPEETIKSSPSELIAEAERRAPAQPATDQQQPWDGQPAYGEGQPAYAEAQPAQFDAGAYSPQPAYAEQGWGPAPQEGETGTPEQAEAFPGSGYSGYSGWAPAATADTHGAYPASGEPYASGEAGGEPVAPPAQPGQSGAGHQAEPAPQVFGAPGAPPLEIVYPLPSGRAQYEGLKSAFVDFPKLLRTLRNDQHTGYVRLDGGGFSGILLFHEGHLLEALSSEPGAQNGDAAFQAVRRSMEAGTSTLDVIDLAGDTVDALAHLLTAPLMYTGLLGRFVNFEALLAHLTEERIEGAVVVVGADDVGIILLSQGQLLGAYTKSNPALSNAATGVGKIASENGARIEVKSGAGAVSAIDVERALSRGF
jgi:hypothetical protein